MRNRNKWTLIFILSILVFCLVSSAQDVRTLNTRIVDILAQFPTESSKQTEELCRDIIQLGPEGIQAMCALLVPPGTGDDTQVRYALHGLTHCLSQDASSEQSMVSEVFNKALVSAPDKDVQVFLIAQMQLISGNEAVKTLARYLNNDRLCDPAARALLTIGSKSAEKAFLKAWGSATKKTLPVLIKALGEMRSQRSVKKLIPIAQGDEPDLRRLARSALANIGDPRAEEVLAKIPVLSTPQERQQAPSLFLLYAQRLAEKGYTTECITICRNIIRTRTAPHEKHVPCNALSLLVSSLGEGALDDLLSALDSANNDLAGRALDLILDIPGEHITRHCMKKIETGSEMTRAGIIRMLGKRGDDIAIPIIEKSIQDTIPMVRHAAIMASARLARNDAVPHLLKVLQENREEDISVVKTTLLAYTDQKAVPALAEAIPEAGTQSRIALLEILAERDADDFLEVVFAETGNENDTVRLAAIKALEPLIEEKDLTRGINLLLQAKGESEISAAGTTVVAAASHIEDPEKRADAVLGAMKKEKSGQRARLAAVLPEIGGKEALRAVVAESRRSSPVIRDAAIQALSNWKDFDAAEHLLSIGRKTRITKHRSQAISGYIRLVKEAPIAPVQKLSMLQSAMDAASGIDEKNGVLSVLRRIRTLESLHYAGTFLDDVALQNNAALAVAAIACPGGGLEKGIMDPAVIPVLKKAITVVEDPYVGKQMENHLDTLSGSPGETAKGLNQPPPGFVALFNGKDLSGWKGLAGKGGNPLSRMKMNESERADAQKEADALMRAHWKVEDGVLVFDGKGSHLCTVRDYGDFEMVVDWKIEPGGDSGIYLRGSPQVQIWDPAQWPEGSGGLYNNQKNPSKPLQRADNPIGEWNTFRIIMRGERVTVYLNDVLVVDNVIMENYWDRNQAIFPAGHIELQSHGSQLYFKNIFIRELPGAGEWYTLFNGKDFTGWMGATDSYYIEDEKIIAPKKGGGNLYTEEEFSDFVLQFEFKLTPGANNGLGIRTPPKGDAAYVGMELQILDNTAHIYKDLQPYQYHGSVYGIVPAKRGHLKPVGEWNFEEVIAKGSHITINLNNVTIVDADIRKASTPKTMDGNAHPGLLREIGHIAFCGHNSHVEFRNIRVKKL